VTAAQPAQPARCRGVRGAISVEANTAEAIVSAARELLEAIVAANGIDAEDVCSLLLTVTPDLTAEYPPSPRGDRLGRGSRVCAQRCRPARLAAACARWFTGNTGPRRRSIRHVYCATRAAAPRPRGAPCL